jgi:hypothetical protein
MGQSLATSLIGLRISIIFQLGSERREGSSKPSYSLLDTKGFLLGLRKLLEEKENLAHVLQSRSPYLFLVALLDLWRNRERDVSEKGKSAVLREPERSKRTRWRQRSARCPCLHKTRITSQERPDYRESGPDFRESGR